MPKSYTIKYFNGGISDYEDRGVRGAFKHGSALNIRKRVDSLSCNQALAEVSAGTFTDLVRFIVPASDGNTYLFGASKIYKKTSADVVSLVYTDPDGQIAGAAEMWLQNGKKYLFWATSTKLKSKEIAGQSDWSDVNATISGLPDDIDQTFPKTNLSAAEWHTMTIANGALMICNSNFLAMVGYDGSYTNEALRLLPKQVAKTLIDRDNLVIIASGSETSEQVSYLYSWEQTALNYLQKKRIPANTINALADGEVTLMQADEEGEIFFSDLYSFQPVTAFPSGGKVNPSGMFDYNGLVYFGVYGADDSEKNGIYSYGRTKKNGTFALNLEYPITCDEIGAVSVVDGVIYATYKATDAEEVTTYHLVKVDSSNKQEAIYESLDLLAPIKLPPRQTSWMGIDIFCKPLPAGTSISAQYRANKSGDWVNTKLEGDVSALTITGATEAIFLAGVTGEVYEFRLVLTPSGNETPEVYKVKVLFE